MQTPMDPNQLVTINLPASAWDNNIKILNKIAMRAKKEFDMVMPIISAIVQQAALQATPGASQGVSQPDDPSYVVPDGQDVKPSRRVSS